jgi:hypothetical protein
VGGFAFSANSGKKGFKRERAAREPGLDSEAHRSKTGFLATAVCPYNQSLMAGADLRIPV